MIRDGKISDLPQITHVRTSVRENHMSVEDLAKVGISEQSIAADMNSGALGCWVAEDSGTVVGFSMADRRNGNIFALFMLPGFEERGFGSKLLIKCEDWLKARGCVEAWLSTDPHSRAAEFYRLKGWVATDEEAGMIASDLHFIKRL